MKRKRIFVFGFWFLVLQVVVAQDWKHYNNSKFRPLKEQWATPNMFRTGAGAPGPKYYQQKVDYKIKVTLDDNQKKILGEATVTYFNNSLDNLEYLWVQLDQNTREKNSLNKLISTDNLNYNIDFEEFEKKHDPFDGGYRIEHVMYNGKSLPYDINWTMMRLDLPTPLAPGKSISFNIKWWYPINNYTRDNGRSGYEEFPDGNRLYVIAQWFPRMAVYNDYMGWQNHQFWGKSEFTLAFGNYEVEISAPTDFMVAATGDLKNPKEVLSPKQLTQLEKAENSFTTPVLIVTQKEAEANTTSRSKNFKTWHFSAKQVRDFAFSASRKFIWDAMAVKMGDKKVMAYSYYPPEGNPLWERYSTKAVAHTLKTFSKYTFDYPYPKAIAVHAEWQGMEYPMICWNYGRPEPDGTYSKEIKYGMIGVIIHEVGHNYFPMIINSDERQWAWLDEGFNTFFQSLAEQSFDADFPPSRNLPDLIVPYMKKNTNTLMPIMTKADRLHHLGSNAYSKTAAGLNILRETILGRKRFDYAFKKYAERWKFKHPTPEDFFRTMEDASGVELDWFWRGWFYTTDYNDIGISKVKYFQMALSLNQSFAEEQKKEKKLNEKRQTIKQNELENNSYVTDLDPTLLDFYNKQQSYKITTRDSLAYADQLKQLSPQQQKLIQNNSFFYEVTFNKPGGLVMPILISFTFEDNSQQKINIPAQIWQLNDKEVTKVFVFNKKVVAMELDPNLETADVNKENNYWIYKNEKPEFFNLSFNIKPNKRKGKLEKNDMQKFQKDNS